MDAVRLGEHYATATALGDGRALVACRCGYLLAATVANLPTLWDQHRLVMESAERAPRPPSRLGFPAGTMPTPPGAP